MKGKNEGVPLPPGNSSSATCSHGSHAAISKRTGSFKPLPCIRPTTLKKWGLNIFVSREGPGRRAEEDGRGSGQDSSPGGRPHVGEVGR